MNKFKRLRKERTGKGKRMFNWHSRKTQKIISSIIIAILVLAMVAPAALSFLY